MRQVEITLTFVDEDGKTRPYTLHLETPRGGSAEGEARVAHHLFSELRVALRDQPEPKHNVTAGKWLEFPDTRRKFDITDYFDVRNSQSLWLELSNLVRGIEYDLEMAHAFKELESDAGAGLKGRRSHQPPLFPARSQDDCARSRCL